MAKGRLPKRSPEWEERRQKRRQFVFEERSKNIMAQCFKLLARGRIAKVAAKEALLELTKPEPNIKKIMNSEILLKDVISGHNSLITAEKKTVKSELIAGHAPNDLSYYRRSRELIEGDKKAIVHYETLLHQILEKKSERGIAD